MNAFVSTWLLQSLKQIRTTAAIAQFRAWVNYTNEPIVLVYTMGKVGSSSVYHALKRTHLRPGVLHMHFLSDHIHSAVEVHLRAGLKALPPHFRISDAVRKSLPIVKPERVFVITLVRDPIAFVISDLFQNPYFYPAAPLDDDTGDPKLLAKYIVETLLVPGSKSLLYWSNWFNEEINEVFDLNVLDHKFDQNMGFSLVQSDSASILEIQLERLDECFERAIEELLNVEVQNPKTKRNDRSLRNSLYKSVVGNVKLPADQLDAIYSENMVRHFYSDEQIQGFKRKWSA